MLESKYLTLNVVLKHPNIEKVGCIVHIRDGYAIAKFSHRIVARMIFADQKKLGRDVVYKERITGFIQKFPNMTKEQIYELLKNQLMKGGGKLIK